MFSYTIYRFQLRKCIEKKFKAKVRKKIKAFCFMTDMVYTVNKEVGEKQPRVRALADKRIYHGI